MMRIKHDTAFFIELHGKCTMGSKCTSKKILQAKDYVKGKESTRSH